MSLQAALKESVFALVDSVQPPKKYKAVVLDRRSRHILDQVLEKSELLNRHVANVLMLDEPRQSESYLEAIYIVDQSSFSLGCIQADFTRIPPRYRRAHVFLLPSSRASESELERFKNSAISRFLTKVEVAPFAFLALESHVFSLGCSSANLLLYNESCRQQVLDFVDLTGHQIANVCQALGEYPYVRHSEFWKVTRNNAFPKLVAAATVRHLEAARPKYMTPELESEPRPTLLILDRSIDLASPLLHDFGFQAMALDLLGKQFETQQDFRTFTSTTGASTGQLTEEDPVWVSVRHKHYAAATSELNERAAVLKAANPHMADPSSKVNVGDLRNMIAALPEFMKSRDNLNLVVDLAYDLVPHVDKGPLRELAEAEQIAALGTTLEGEQHPDALLTAMVVGLLARKEVTRGDKIRLLALYVLYRGNGLYDTDYDKLRHHSGLSPDDINTVKALDYLGYQMRKAGGEQAAKHPQQSLLREHRDQAMGFARVQCGLQTIVEQLLAHELDRTLFPFDGDEPNMEQEAMNVATSLRNPRQRATWAQNVVTPSSSIASDASGGHKSRSKGKKRIILFMLGGFTAAESAAMYRLSEERPRTIILGGHDWLTPSKYLDFLRKITVPRDQLGLPEDVPEPKVPEFLSASDRQNQKAAAAGSRAAGSGTAGSAAGATATGRPGAPPQQPAYGGHATLNGPGANQASYRTPQTAQQQQLEQQRNAMSLSQGLGSMSLETGAGEEKKKDKKDKNMKSRFKGAFKKKGKSSD